MSGNIINILKQIGDNIINNKNELTNKIFIFLLAFIPLILDSLFYHQNFNCPQNNYIFYSIFMLICPTISVIIVAITVCFQYIYNNLIYLNLKLVI